MLTLKAALVAASAVGAVTVGGVTWAAVDTTPETDPRSAGSKVVSDAQATAKSVTSKAPQPAATCLPSDLPATPDQLPKGKLPADLKAKLPAALKKELAAGRLNDAQVKKKIVELSKTVPTCAPEPGDLRKKAPKAPENPAAGVAPDFNCGNVPPAVEVGGTVERAVMAAKGLKYVAASPGTPALEAQRVCTVTQKWVGSVGGKGWLTVQRVDVPKGMSQAELQRAMKLPSGSPVDGGGGVAWRTDRGSGVLLFDQKGYSLVVQGSPGMSTGLPALADKVRQAAG